MKGHSNFILFVLLLLLISAGKKTELDISTEFWLEYGETIIVEDLRIKFSDVVDERCAIENDCSISIPPKVTLKINGKKDEIVCCGINNTVHRDGYAISGLEIKPEYLSVYIREKKKDYAIRLVVNKI